MVGDVKWMRIIRKEASNVLSHFDERRKKLSRYVVNEIAMTIESIRANTEQHLPGAIPGGVFVKWIIRFLG